MKADITVTKYEHSGYEHRCEIDGCDMPIISVISGYREPEIFAVFVRGYLTAKYPLRMINLDKILEES